MFGVTLSFMQLNRMDPNAGASYAWVGKAFGPAPGFFAGWSLLVASAVSLVAGTIPAAAATLALIDPDLARDPGTVTLVAAGWLLAVSGVIVKGIKPTSYTQLALTGVEVAILVLVIGAALIEFGRTPVRPFSLQWFSLAAFSPQLFASGALTALVFFWGWDVTLNLNEETRDATRAPGHGALLAMIIVLLLFLSFVTAALLVLSDAAIEQSGTNVVLAIADRLFPRPWSYMAVIAVMLSTVGTLETSILQFTRTMFAQGRDGALHPRYARLHASWRTPWVATAVITAFGLVLLFAASFFASVNAIMKDSVNAVGLQVAFYYSLACLACAWTFRRHASGSPAKFIGLVLWPIASAAFLAFVAIASVPTFDVVTNCVGVGGIAVGIVPFWRNRSRAARRSAR